jgi:hypothetical protein
MERRVVLLCLSCAVFLDQLRRSGGAAGPLVHSLSAKVLIRSKIK